MATRANEPRKEANNDFGLPQAEFKPLEHGSNNWLTITAIIVGFVLLMGGGVVYWLFFRTTTPQEPTALTQEEENFTTNADINFIESEPAEEQAQAPDENVTASKNAYESTAQQPQETPPAAIQPQKGIITKVTAPQGKYYVVVGSFIDRGLAEDDAKKLSKKSESLTILFPKAGKNYYRVSVAQSSTLAGANEAAASFKAQHSVDTWVLKY